MRSLRDRMPSLPKMCPRWNSTVLTLTYSSAAICRLDRPVHANLSDEFGRPVPHLELFDTFAAADGARAWWQFLDERQTAA